MHFPHLRPTRAQNPHSIPQTGQNTLNTRPEIATARVTALVLNGARVLSPTLSFGAVCLLARLCEFVFEPRRWADADVIITPANARIARSLAVCERTARRFLLELENSGWILRHYSATNQRHGKDAGINLRPVAARLEALRQVEQAMRATPRKNGLEGGSKTGDDDRAEPVDNIAVAPGSGRTDLSTREDGSVHLVIPYRTSPKNINVPNHAGRDEGRVDTGNTATWPEPAPAPGCPGRDDDGVSAGRLVAGPELPIPAGKPQGSGPSGLEDDGRMAGRFGAGPELPIPAGKPQGSGPSGLDDDGVSAGRLVAGPESPIPAEPEEGSGLSTVADDRELMEMALLVSPSLQRALSPPELAMLASAVTPRTTVPMVRAITGLVLHTLRLDPGLWKQALDTHGVPALAAAVLALDKPGVRCRRAYLRAILERSRLRITVRHSLGTLIKRTAS